MKSIESKLKSIESKLKSIENQLKSIESKLKSIENQLKIIEINWLHRIQDRKLENFHIKEDLKIVKGGDPYTNQDPTLYNHNLDVFMQIFNILNIWTKLEHPTT